MRRKARAGGKPRHRGNTRRSGAGGGGSVAVVDGVGVSARNLRRLKFTVEKFVEGNRTKETPELGDTDGTGSGPGLGKSRKQARREQRLLKKRRKRDYYLRKHLEPDREAEGESPGSGGVTEEEEEEEKETSPGNTQETQPAPVGPRPHGGPSEARNRGLREANREEEKEIKWLERALGLNRRRRKSGSIPRSLARDGLDYILGAIPEPGAALSALYGSDGSDAEGEEEEAAASVLQKLMDDDDEEEKEPGQSEVVEEDDEEGEEQGQSEEDDEADEEDVPPGHESEEEEEEMEVEVSSSRNSLELRGSDCGRGSRTPGEDQVERSNNSATGKYIPPQLRRMGETLDVKKKEELERLKKAMKGLLNRLSEPNMASICGQFEELYMTNSRKDVNDTLTDLLLAACVTPALMSDRLLMEHVLLVSILHHNVGIEVGAHILEIIVKQFDELSRHNTEGKECDNLINLVAQLYNFHVIHAVLIFDILKKLTSNFNEKDIELILFLLKRVGFSLRKDDALALKGLILEGQNKANSVGKQFQDQTRVRFMLETMLALKNNDVRKIPGYDPEPVERLRKLQRSLVRKSGGDFQLRATLENLLAADQVGRWWIVGSSWSGAPMIDNSSKTQQQNVVGEVSAKMMEFARKQRMNTEIRRNIFCVVMTSEDYLDAFEKLLRLGLKNQQEREIIHIVIGCCLQEKTFNPFYAFLLGKFCEYERRFQMTFQFTMWDRFRDLESMTTTTTTNLINLLVHLLGRKVLSLSIFKVIEFSELDKPKVKFLRQILVKLLLELEPEELTSIFQRISGIPKLALLREGLKLFITHFLLKNASNLGSSQQANLLKEHIDLAKKALQAKDAKLKF